MAALPELEERRAVECRLRPDRALESPDDAARFLCERGLLTRTPDSALPSFFAACHEQPYAAGSGGFGSWPATKWPWFEELAQRRGVYALKIHRGKHVLLAEKTAALADPILRSEVERMRAADPGWALVLDHLAAAGPSTPAELCAELGLRPTELKALRAPLERCGAVVTHMVRVELPDGGHDHVSELTRWDAAYPEPSGRGGIEDLLVAGVRAAVVAPEREVPRWFSWRWLVPDRVVDRLVADGRLERVEPGFVTAV